MRWLRAPQFWYFAVTLASMVVLAIWLGAEDQSRRESAVFSADQPDYFMEDFSLVTLDGDGRARYTLEASRMDHFDVGDILDFKKPRLTVTQGVQGQWRVAADAGEITQSQQLYLKGNVNIVQSVSPDQTLKIETSYLEYELNDNTAETTKPVTIAQGDNRVYATGMRVNVNEQKVELLSNVKGQYFVP